MVHLCIDPAPRCKKETMKKVKSGVGKEIRLIEKNMELEDCKSRCLRKSWPNLVSLKYCSISKECTYYSDAPNDDTSSNPLPEDCTVYVKSCGNF